MDNRAEVRQIIASIAEARRQVVEELADVSRDVLETPTEGARWTEVRRVLLRFGDHPREHAVQIVAAREAIGAPPTMPQRILAKGQEGYGELLASLVGVTDADLDASPGAGEWTIRQVLEHVLKSERNYLASIQRALGADPVSAERGSGEPTQRA